MYDQIIDYDKLCEFMRKERDKKHKKRQLEEFRKSYEIVELSKDQYIIKNRYSIIDKAKLQESDYGKNKMFLEPLIYTILSTSKTNTIRCSMPDFMIRFDMCNPNFKYAKNESLEFDTYVFSYPTTVNSNHEISRIFTTETDTMFRVMIKRIFDDMKDRNLIFVKEYLMANKPTNIAGQKSVTLELTNDEYELYMHTYNKYMGEFGKEKKTDLSYYERRDIKDKTCKELGYNYVYSEYEIILNRLDIKEQMIVRKDFGEFKDMFNKHIKDKIGDSTRKGYKRLTTMEIDKCVEYLIDTNNTTDFKSVVRYRKELDKKLTTEQITEDEFDELHK